MGAREDAHPDRVEDGIWAYLRRIDELGGAVEAAKRNFFQAELADTAYGYQRRKERGDLVVVGVNKHADAGGSLEIPFTLHEVDPGAEAQQQARLARVKRGRDSSQVERCLAELADVARGDDNLIPPTIEAVKAYATAGEIVKALRAVFGTYVEDPVF